MSRYAVRRAWRADNEHDDHAPDRDILECIREFHLPSVSVYVDALQDFDLDLSFDEDGSIAKAIEAGELQVFCVKISVVHNTLGEIATDYLGNCIYASYEAFMDHKECGTLNRTYRAKGEDHRCGSYFKDMIATACAEARVNLCRRRLELS